MNIHGYIIHFWGRWGSLYVVLAGLELAGIFLPLPPVLGLSVFVIMASYGS